MLTIITSEIKLHMVQSYLKEKRLSKEAKLMKFLNVTKIHFLESQTVKCPVLSNQSQNMISHDFNNISSVSKRRLIY